MTGYIACGMTGIDLFNWPHFEAWERKLTDAGWHIVSPTRIDEAVGSVLVTRDEAGAVLDVQTSAKFKYEAILSVDFIAIEHWCDAIILLPGWETSSGAKRELEHAESLGLRVFTAEEALNV